MRKTCDTTYPRKKCWFLYRVEKDFLILSREVVQQTEQQLVTNKVQNNAYNIFFYVKKIYNHHYIYQETSCFMRL